MRYLVLRDGKPFYISKVEIPGSIPLAQPGQISQVKLSESGEPVVDSSLVSPGGGSAPLAPIEVAPEYQPTGDDNSPGIPVERVLETYVVRDSSNFVKAQYQGQALLEGEIIMTSPIFDTPRKLWVRNQVIEYKPGQAPR